jgi:hypothetical protein
MVCTKTAQDLEYCRLTSVFASMNAISSLSAINISDTESLIAHLILKDDQIRDFASPGNMNRDNKPLLDFSRERKDTADYVVPLLTAKTTLRNTLHFDESCTADSAAVFNRITLLSQLLLQHSLLPSSVQKRNVVDFFEVNGSLIQRYL